MLNIKSKKEVEQAVHDNLNRFTDVKKSIIEKSFNRDEAIIISEVLPKLRHTIALTHYMRDVEWFDFSLPLINFDGYDLSEEEKELIIHEYYQKEGVLWVDNGHRGEIGKASLVSKVFEEIFQRNVSFKSCEINTEINTVDFKLHLVDKMLKIKVKEEQLEIVALLDEYLLPHLQFNKIADTINECYESLMGENLMVLYQNDLDTYPVLSLNVDEILDKTDFYDEIGLSGDCKIDIREYITQSKLIKSLKRKLNKYGYGLQYATTSSEKWYRSNGIDFSVSAYYTSKGVKDESLLKSETLVERFEQKRTEYVDTLIQKAEKQNEKLVELVESGHFDGMVMEKWVKATLMSKLKITGSDFRGERSIDEELYFRFTVPFDRELHKAKKFKRTHYRADGVGNRYMKLENNMVEALKKRYPFFENARLYGESEMDFQAREGVFNSDSHQWIPDTLTFGFAAGRSTYILRKEEILNWLASSYGILPIEDILKNIDFNEEGISKKIEAYVHHHKEGKTTPEEPFKIVLGNITSNQLLDLYEESPLCEKSKELFENTHEEDFFCSYWRLKEDYKKAKTEEFQSLKLVNLFVHALFVHPVYKEIKTALNALDYELKVAYKKEEIKRMETGKSNIYGGDIPDDVCKYSVEIVVE